ncbi:sodium-dependent transporter bedraggled [Uranotaenia lowii]|uniref:sodium-dependent transporter bedraggled n=1 Tax=Uranotaenia lowii TaxID=190385 RepID=UPI002478714B|nr:sodium-dependent transporter bedraggled [Uranotaenia lowii]XP_055589822.1 sodium-dependent transporter bedraggled [Uranotaenia lowii]
MEAPSKAFDSGREPIDGLGHFCTLRKNNARTIDGENSTQGANDRHHVVRGDRDNLTKAAGNFYCTLRGGGSQQSPAGSFRESDVDEKMGNSIGKHSGASFYENGSDGEDRAELNRNLLYEENMSTFESFCEKSALEGGNNFGEEDSQGGASGVVGAEGIENFCTLRRKRSQQKEKVNSVRCDSNGEIQETSLVDPKPNNVGNYCTLKKKKLQLNQRFVESFLEDPHAKLHDYLSELDAYLDEIDGLDSFGNSSEDEGKIEDEEEKIEASHGENEAVSDKEVKISENVQDPAAPPISYSDIKHFCTLPKRKRVQFLNSARFGDRTSPLRRTFFVTTTSNSKPIRITETSPSDQSVAVANAAADADADRRRRDSLLEAAGAGLIFAQPADEAHGNGTSDFVVTEPTSTSITASDSRRTAERPRRASNWLRNSMRKVRPIQIPDQDIPASPSPPPPEVRGSSSYEGSGSDLQASNITNNHSITRSSISASSPSSSTSHEAQAGRAEFDSANIEFSSLNSLADEGNGHHPEQEAEEDHNELSSITTLPIGELLERNETKEDQRRPVPSAPPATTCVPITEDELIPYLVSASLCERATIPAQETLPTNERPRQTGRRSEPRPRVVSITAERDSRTNQLIIRTNTSGSSPIPSGGISPRAPSAPVISDLEQRHHHYSSGASSNHHQQQHLNNSRHQERRHQYVGMGMGSETSSIGSSRNPSPVSLLSTTTYSSMASGVETEGSRSRPDDDDGRDAATRSPSSTVAAESQTNGGTTATIPSGTDTSTTTTITNDPGLDSDELSDESDEYEPEIDLNGRPKPNWPHVMSRSLAGCFCTLGLFNISRFAIFSVHFGANFIVQFLIFSFLFGIPMLWLQMVLGARIRGSPINMWRISPICKGIGISLLLAQGFIALYSTISLSWVLVYFRDSFVSRSEKYRWQEIFELYRGSGNQSFRLSDTVADYFNGVVLQRYQLGPGSRGLGGIGAVRFQLAFNLAIIWTIVFVVLCKGIRSFGKIVIGLFSFAMIGLIAICSKFVTMVDFDSVQSIFPATEWQDFFLNSRSWMSAAQETFLTWGLLGVSIYSINGRTNRKGANRKIRLRELRRDALFVTLLTLIGLMLAAVFGSACVQILNTRKYYYFPGSYENIGTDIFLLPSDQPLPPQHATMPTKWLIRYSMVLGESYKRPYANPHQESGYQVIRLVTELFPSTLAAATQERIGPIWSLIGFLTLLLFGLGQLCAMWKPIAEAVGDSPSSVVLSCVTGLFMGIPLATESGITIIHYLDSLLGGAWWLLVLWIGHILAIFLVRGRPFTSDLLADDLRMTGTLSAFIAFAWNFLLPIGLIFLCILEYRVSNANSLFNWRHGGYWPLWARQIGGFIQLSFLLLVPIVSVVQIYRYLFSGPPDILQRFDNLLRPSIGLNGTTSRSRRTSSMDFPQRVGPPGNFGRSVNSGSTMISLPITGAGATIVAGRGGSVPLDDAPPKYTPPPSYTTATGARIAKMLRNSIRRSVRRIMGEPSNNRQRGAIPHQQQYPTESQTATTTSVNPTGDELPPPDYSTVQIDRYTPSGGVEMGPRILYNSETLSSRRGRGHRSLTQSTGQNPTSSLTATDVLQILRPATTTLSVPPTPTNLNRSPSFALGTTTAAIGYGNVDLVVRDALNRRHSMRGSVENLVLGAAPLGDSSIITLALDEDEHCRHGRSRGTDSVI